MGSLTELTSAAAVLAALFGAGLYVVADKRTRGLSGLGLGSAALVVNDWIGTSAVSMLTLIVLAVAGVLGLVEVTRRWRRRSTGCAEEG